MTPRQNSLSGVIICPAYWKGQRLRANSFATTNSSIKNQVAPIVKVARKDSTRRRHVMDPLNTSVIPIW
jgi:hypothetical protein